MSVGSNSVRSTASCIGPVLAPTRSLTWYTVPVPGTSRPPADTLPALNSGLPQVHEGPPAAGAENSNGITLQPKLTFGAWLRLAPIVTGPLAAAALAGATADSSPHPAASKAKNDRAGRLATTLEKLLIKRPFLGSRPRPTGECTCVVSGRGLGDYSR